MGLRIEICLLFISTQFLVATAQTNTQYFAALEALKDAWTNIPPNWGGPDPCGSSWVGIQCNNSRITSIILPSMGLFGQLTGDIAQLSALQIVDLSYNSGLTGSLPPSIGNLTKLTTLALEGCGFYGPIPGTIGYLQQLRFLYLSSNSFTGSIPSSIGNLSNLFWLDLSVNNLSGTIPVSSGTTPGLDMLVNTKHFHFGNNQLSGAIPARLFNSSMTLIHVLFESNQLNGTIPSTLALVLSLEVVRLDRNSLTGSVPSNFSNLVYVNVLYLSNNQLTGPLPNLSSMNDLYNVDLSNNTFDTSLFPSWFSNLLSLTTIVMENTRLNGSLPGAIFNLPQLQAVSLSNNQLNGILDVGTSYGNQLKLVDLQNNSISDFIFTERVGASVEFILVGNPACSGTGGTNTYCAIPPSNSSYSFRSYSFPSKKCIPPKCSSNEVSSPNCRCAYPYTGTLFFKAPSFSDLGNSTIYTALGSSLLGCFQSNQLPVDSLYLSNPTENTDNYLLISLELFPYGQDRFNRTGISGIAFVLSNQTFNPPSTYGPFSFKADPYNYFAGNNLSNRGVITGVAVGGSVVLLLALLAGFYAFRQKRRAERADRVNNPFASWNPNTTSGGVPLLQEARCFSYDELKKYTNNFAEANRIGSGGYGKVYRGTLSNGQLVAIKRAKQGSLQGGLEFKMEIELLSRIHHKNVVGLMGFCFERAEQMLVYEYIANGTLHESLSGKTGINLDWMRRLRIALGVARGLQYLHELANPPIIHRDIKSSNILLDERLNAKVSDFGLSKPMGDAEKSHISTQVKGTMGYMDPEYYMTQQLTEKSDVYSFGVVLLELVTARQPIEKGKYIVREVRQRMIRDQVLYSLDEILDPVILAPPPKGLEQFVDLAMRFVEEEGARRPGMGAVVKEIENVMLIAGLNPNDDSSSTSATHEGDGKGYNHPYTDDSLFVYSGTFPLASN
ncbi:leucine-rich repeat receptor protein kinase HPCA1-like isoform X2 [Rhododendron vialii]|uniref:leucine-rich repeat receptor protein kinase HPCA1-like isoform X2 n=1 Tax=Rhododendron vialii TaxID=182163 RepID=UPI00265E0041|nr:leucine-rich repeat receptor protein kinase HPCA1-like isoform X2 [Rhododendron vialii]